MNARVPVSKFFIDVAASDIRKNVGLRIEQFGPGSYIGPHETLGILTEEYKELVDAVHSNDHAQVEKELIDIAVGALFGVASLRANDAIASRRVEKTAAPSDAGERKVSPWMSVREAAKHYGISPFTIYRAIKAGTIPHSRIGRRVVVNGILFDRLLVAGNVQQPTTPTPGKP